jgi:hypothetical protein
LPLGGGESAARGGARGSRAPSTGPSGRASRPVRRRCEAQGKGKTRARTTSEERRDEGRATYVPQPPPRDSRGAALAGDRRGCSAGTLRRSQPQPSVMRIYTRARDYHIWPPDTRTLHARAGFESQSRCKHRGSRLHGSSFRTLRADLEGRRAVDARSLRRSGSALHLRLDRALPARLDEVDAVEVGGAGGDLADEVVRDPTGVLGALTRVEAVDDVPEVVLLASGDRGAQRLVGVGADEGQAVEDDPQPAGLDVVLDQRRQRLPCPLSTVGALQVGVLKPVSPALLASRGRRPAARCRRRATARAWSPSAGSSACSSKCSTAKGFVK